MDNTNGLFGIWCKICAMFNSIIMLCQSISVLATNLTTISMNNVLIKDKIEALVGDPDADCPDCPPPTEGLVAEQGVTANMVETTTSMQAATAALQVKTQAVRTKLGISAEKKAAAEKEAQTAPAAERIQPAG